MGRGVPEEPSSPVSVEVLLRQVSAGRRASPDACWTWFAIPEPTATRTETGRPRRNTWPRSGVDRSRRGRPGRGTWHSAPCRRPAADVDWTGHRCTNETCVPPLDRRPCVCPPNILQTDRFSSSSMVKIMGRDGAGLPRISFLAPPHSVGDNPKESCMPKTSSIRAVVSIHYWLVTTDRQTHAQIDIGP